MNSQFPYVFRWRLQPRLQPQHFSKYSPMRTLNFLWLSSVGSQVKTFEIPWRHSMFFPIFSSNPFSVAVGVWNFLKFLFGHVFVRRMISSKEAGNLTPLLVWMIRKSWNVSAILVKEKQRYQIDTSCVFSLSGSEGLLRKPKQKHCKIIYLKIENSTVDVFRKMSLNVMKVQ